MHKKIIEKECQHLLSLLSFSEENLNIDSLSKAKEIVAKYKGFQSWYELDKVLSLKDSQRNTYFSVTNIQNSFELSQYKKHLNFIQTNFEKLNFKTTISKSYCVKKQTHTPVFAGSQQSKNVFSNKKTHYPISSYPMLALGSVGAGLSETMLTYAYQNINNNEGVIYMDGKGDTIIYNKFFSFMSEQNKLDNLYCLNMIYLNKESSKNTHTINPLTYILQSKENFSSIFGEVFTNLVYDYLLEQEKNGFNISIHSFQNLVTIHTLKTILEEYPNNLFIQQYLLDIGIDLNNQQTDEALKNASFMHLMNIYEAVDIISHIQEYIDCGTFSDEPNIDLLDIIYNRKTLVVITPVFLKPSNTSHKMTQIIYSNIYYAEVESRKENTHFQNIYFSDIKPNLFCNTDVIPFNTTPNNYIFSNIYTYETPLNNFEINNFSSFLIMKNNNRDLQIIDFFHGLYYDYVTNVSFDEFLKTLSDFSEGDAFFVTTENTQQDNSLIGKSLILKDEVKYIYNEPFKLSKIKCSYYSPPKVDKIYLVEHNSVNGKV